MFVCTTAAHVEDAIAVQRWLPKPAQFVALWPQAAIRARDRADESRIVDLSTTAPDNLHKILLTFRGRAVLGRLRRDRPAPSFVFGSDVNPPEVAFITSLRRSGARTVLLQDGFLDSHDPERFGAHHSGFAHAALTLLSRAGVMYPVNRLYGSAGCDEVCVFGPATRDLLVGQGMASERITVTGAPRFDSLFEALSPPAARGGPRALLYLGLMVSARHWGTLDDDRRWFRGLARLAAEKRDWRVTLRPHPTEPRAAYERLIAEFGTPIALDDSADVHASIKRSGVVAMHFPSSVLFEAVASGVPCLLVDLNLPLLAHDLQRDTFLGEATSPEDLSGGLGRVLDRGPQDREPFLSRHLGFTDGRSAERVATVVGRS